MWKAPPARRLNAAWLNTFIADRCVKSYTLSVTSPAGLARRPVAIGDAVDFNAPASKRPSLTTADAALVRLPPAAVDDAVASSPAVDDAVASHAPLATSTYADVTCGADTSVAAADEGADAVRAICGGLRRVCVAADATDSAEEAFRRPGDVVRCASPRPCPTSARRAMRSLFEPLAVAIGMPTLADACNVTDACADAAPSTGLGRSSKNSGRVDGRRATGPVSKSEKSKEAGLFAGADRTASSFAAYRGVRCVSGGADAVLLG
mmetsp:Transcript_45204/g.125417  ORF Transcript_45204/g.125417 Transcript_45204/m.125417 type:complete len:264 (+) Transcript_45204:871-1662(+)